MIRAAFLFLLALGLLAALAGCASTPAPAPQIRVTDTACSWVHIITLSAQDTTETKRQVLAHDQAVKANCPGAGSGQK